jgi:hypothetical protein
VPHAPAKFLSRLEYKKLIIAFFASSISGTLALLILFSEYDKIKFYMFFGIMLTSLSSSIFCSFALRRENPTYSYFVIGFVIGFLQNILLSMIFQAPHDALNVLPQVEGTLPQGEGVGVKIVAVRQSRDRGATFVDLHYSVTIGSAGFSWHDPAHFVQLISDGVALTPIWASAPARNLPSNSRQDILVRFPSPPTMESVVFRFGEEHYLDLSARVAD